jgi:hypothetical protein
MNLIGYPIGLNAERILRGNCIYAIEINIYDCDSKQHKSQCYE